MSPSKRKKILIGAGGVIGLLILVALIAPSFIDLNAHKPEIVAEVKKATGRDLVIDGPVSLSILPLPSVSVTGIKFFNMPGASNPHMVEVKAVIVKPSVFALLLGNLEVSEVVLVEPKIVLEVNAQGKPNWEFAPSVAEAKPAAPQPSSAKPLSLGRLTFENGTIAFSDSKAGISVVAEKANFSASVGSLDGPYGLTGGATVNGAPLKIDLSVGAKGAKGLPTELALEAGGGKLTFKGSVSELGPNAALSGVASISADSLTSFASALIGLSGQKPPALPPLLANKFSFDGGIEASQTAFAAKDFKLNLAGDSGSGSISVTLKPTLAVDGKILLPHIDLDRALASLQSSPAAAPAPATNTAAAPPPAAGPAASPAASDSYLSKLNAKIDIEAKEIIYNKAPVRDVVVNLEAKNGAVAVPKLSATLPGDMVLRAQSTMAGASVAGDFSLVGPKLRDTLKWLAVDVSSMPDGKLTQLSLKGRLTSAGGNVQITDAAFQLDDIKGAVGVTVAFVVPITVTANVNIDTIDLDPFLAKPPAGAPKSSGAAKPAPAAASPPAGGPVLGLKTKIAKVIYNKQPISGIDIDLALQGGTLTINNVAIGNLAGARFALRGLVENYASALPKANVAFNFEAPELSKVLELAGAAPSGDMGLVKASGGIIGTVEDVTFKDLTVSGRGNTVQVNGTLAMPGAAHGAASSVSYKGSIASNGQTIEGSVAAKIADRTSITADLKATSLDVDKLFVSPPSVAQNKAKPAATAQAAEQPIDTKGMRSFDASLKFTAGTLVSSPLRIGNADVAVTLKEGVLTLNHFKGNLYGGTLDLSGTVDGSKTGLAIDFKGDASNIIVSEILRSTAGHNTFGGAVKVTVDGKINASGIALKGAGTTMSQLKGSMAGGAKLGGYIFVGADKALTAVGGAATGLVGGVIDNTLGSALGIVGQGGGVGAGNMLNAASLLLNRFVNRNNPIGGEVDIAGGMLTDKGLNVQGNGAAANIATHTNFTTSTTDTTVNFTIKEDGSAPYIVASVRGPLSSPSYSVSRGTAKDPPGFVNTLGSGVGQIANPVKSIVPNIPVPSLFGR
ncbi:MAG TPA: AsmA family protein [Reyranella sp.]|nr:AsmA family protein [Reyranella sp.]